MYPVTTFFKSVVNSGGIQYSIVDAVLGNDLVVADIPVVSGSVTDVSKPGIRRKLDIELFPSLGLFDELSPSGIELHPRSVIRYPSGVTESIPMGKFGIDSISKSYGSDGAIKVKGSDRWARIQRGRFLRPEASMIGEAVTVQITKLLRDLLGPDAQVNNFATSTDVVPAVVWEKDRDKAINDLAESIGARVSFDRDGIPTIEDLPTVTTPPVWTVEAGPTGVMITAARDISRERTYNVVVVTSDKADGVAPFPPIIISDNISTSPTYAGPDPYYQLSSAAPFGIVPYFYTSPLLTYDIQAMFAGNGILQRIRGLASQLSMEFVRNHALDSFDTIDVTLPPERYDQPAVTERHVIDQIVHPLLPTGANTVETRSSRADDIT